LIQFIYSVLISFLRNEILSGERLAPNGLAAIAGAELKVRNSI